MKNKIVADIVAKFDALMGAIAPRANEFSPEDLKKIGQFQAKLSEHLEELGLGGEQSLDETLNNLGRGVLDTFMDLDISPEDKFKHSASWSANICANVLANTRARLGTGTMTQAKKIVAIEELTLLFKSKLMGTIMLDEQFDTACIGDEDE